MKVSVKKVVENVDFRSTWSLVDQWEAKLTRGEGVLVVNKAETRARLLLHGACFMTLPRADKGKTYDLSAIKRSLLTTSGFIVTVQEGAVTRRPSVKRSAA